jgi:hypothetical protein
MLEFNLSVGCGELPVGLGMVGIAINRTTYFFTIVSFAAMIASIAPGRDESESSNPFKLVEATH